MTWDGDTLGSMEHMARPIPMLAGRSALSADFSQYVGGLVSGPLILYGGADGGASADHPPALVVGPASEFDVGRMMHVQDEDRIVGGVQ